MSDIIQALKEEFQQVKGEIKSLESQVNDKRTLYSALFNLLVAKGYDPRVIDKKAQENVAEEIPALADAIRRATSQMNGKPFGVDQILPQIAETLPDTDRAAVSFALWKMAQRGELKTIKKGTRGSAATYARIV